MYALSPIKGLVYERISIIFKTELLYFKAYIPATFVCPR